MTLVFEEATHLHTSLLAKDIRPEDRAEVWVMNRLDLHPVLHMSVVESDPAIAVSDEDGLVCIYGVRTMIAVGGLGVPWLIGTHRMEDHKRELISLSREFLQAAFTIGGFDRLENAVWAGNTPAIRYLKALGFRFSELYETRYGDAYYRFWKDRNDV